jgi:TolA-binding protein
MAAMPLAILLERSPQSADSARRVLAEFVDAPAIASRAAEQFRAALFELGSLSYRLGEVAEAAARLEKFCAQFPRDEKWGEAAFILGECYLAAAGEDKAQLASAEESKPAQEMERLAVQRKQRLLKACGQFARCSEHYAAQPPTADVDRRYHVLAELRRADCAYELGDYDGALAMYQVIATRWPDDPVALASGIQIVNLYHALNRLDDARTANERVRTVLAAAPERAFTESGTPAGGRVLNKTHWEQWLKWSESATASAW